VERRAFTTDNGDGWKLDVHRFFEPERLDPARRPLLMIPGYCMNTFVLGFHPGGLSLVEYLARAGFEVWTANLRGQGGSFATGGTRNVGFRHFALVDLPAVIETALAHTKTDEDRVDALGCSLGGSFLFAYLAHNIDDHRVGSVVAIGAPLRWEAINPVIKAVFRSPRLAAKLKISGTRAMARRALPLLKRVPPLMSIYMNVKHVDLSQAELLVQTVDDPVPELNREICQWMLNKDLVLDGVNVTEAMRRIDRPLLALVANNDGIVPPLAARSAIDVFGGAVRDVLHVGDDREWFAHADLFIGRTAHARVFAPLARWLETQNA